MELQFGRYVLSLLGNKLTLLSLINDQAAITDQEVTKCLKKLATRLQLPTRGEDVKISISDQEAMTQI